MIADLKYALRMLIKTPAFTLIAVITLALGIGANSAIFSVIDTVLLRPLSFPKSEQLVMIWNNNLKSEPDGRYTSSFPNFHDYRAQSRSFTGMAAYTGAGTVLTGIGDAKELTGVAVDGDFFEVLGLQPMLGRGFTAEEAKVGAPNVVVFSYEAWQRIFGGNASIIGQQVGFSGRSYTVLGVMPRGWKFPVEFERCDYISALQPITPQEVPRRDSSFLKLVARLQPGVTAKQASTLR